MKDEEYMRKAIQKAEEGIKKGQTPFGSCIVKDGEIIVCEHNTVWETTDITAHSEINSIRKACHKLDTINLTGCTIYSTTEPCPMCFSAAHWAKIDKIIYGTTIADAQKAGFSELTVSDNTLKDLGQSPIQIEGGILLEENQELFKKWQKNPKNRKY